MDEFDQAVNEELAKGIQTVISEEFNIDQWRSQAQSLRKNGEILQGQAKMLAGAQRVVHNAARNTQRTFHLTQIKAELQNAFNELLDPLNNIRADHSSTEDDELLALAKKLLDGKDGDVQKLYKSLSNYLRKYREAVDLANQAATNIGDNNMAKFNSDLLKFMQDGYIFLSHLGETIRGTPILYEVTVQFGDGLHKTGIFTIEELMNNTRIEMHRGTYMLRFSGASGLAMSQWSDELEKQYKTFKNNETIKQNNWNEGELIEAFQEATTYIFNEELERAIGATPENIIELNDHGRHYLIHTKLNLSYTRGPDFFSSVDKIIDQLFLEDNVDEARMEILHQHSIRKGNVNYVAIQAKAEGATFTNLNGLVRSLIDADNALTSLYEVKNQVQGKTNISGVGNAIKKAAEDLVQQFLPGAS